MKLVFKWERSQASRREEGEGYCIQQRKLGTEKSWRVLI